MRDPDDRLEKRILELVEENRKLSIAMDESSRLRALESKLFQAARLDAVAAAAAALAHELNQPLTAAASLARLTQHLLADTGSEISAPAGEAIEQLVAEVLRAGQTVARLRGRVGRSEMKKRRENVAAMIEDARAVALSSSGTPGIDVRRELDTKASWALADGMQIREAIVELLRNALEAVAASERREVTITTAVLDADTIEIAVADTGPGLEPTVAEHLFEPFVSTKADGLGLGLPICRAIVEGHDGRLRARPSPEGGMIFSFSLARPKKETTAASERVVHIVDDDAAIRRSLENLLRAANFAPITYETGTAVIEAVTGLTSGCLLLDLVMPGLGGLEVQARLRRLGVRLPVIVMTGQGDMPTAVKAMKAGAVDFIEKPFDEDRLVASIEAALGSDRAASPPGHEVAEAAGRMAALSPREREVLEALVAGRPNKAIAFDLGISVRTVEVHRARMLERLGTTSLAEAVRLAVLATMVPALRR